MTEGKKDVVGEVKKEAVPTRTALRPSGEAPLEWVPKTKLGKEVLEGKITDIRYLFENGIKITEPEIVDILLPGLSREIIYIGGSSGKGGGIRRTASKRTTRMHKSGRRFKVTVMVVVGDSNGYLGVGVANGPAGKSMEVIDKGIKKAKLNIIPIRRGCGSWECKCGSAHSIPFEVSGKSGSVNIKLKPAPKGIGLCVSNEVKKVIRLSGINDVWSKSRGQRVTRMNLIGAIFDALKKLAAYRIDTETQEKIGMKTGRAE
jgi:small subunit ribosomal protein S5